jgi:membrane protein DedA with SNARE-associated domain
VWHLLLQHRYALLVATAFLNQVALLVPVVPFLISTGALAARHHVDLTSAIVALAAGIAPADFVWYLLGRRSGGRLLSRICRAALEPASCVRKTKNVFSRHGARVFLVAKFVPGLSTVAMPLAGALEMRARRFLVYDGAGVLLWTAAYTVVGFTSARQIVASSGRVTLPRIVSFFIFASASYIAWRLVRRRRFVRQLRIARIDPTELHEMLDAGADVTVVDLRHAIDVEADPHAIPGALHIPAEQFGARHREIPRDRAIVLYCS